MFLVHFSGSLFIPFISGVIQKYPESEEHFKVIAIAIFFLINARHL